MERKRIFLFSLLFLLIPQSADANLTLKTWDYLNHSGAYQKLNPNFYLSKPYNSKEELKLSHSKITSDKYWRCDFPARAYFIQQYKKLKSLDFSHCDTFSDFKRRAPATSLSIVFASESISNPSSALGHSFIKINENTSDTSHAFSFFTPLSDVDPVTLLIKTLITGKKGVFTMTPYVETSHYYLNSEQRDLWEYQVKLTKQQLNLLHYHLYELKNVNLKYYFHGYNCSTLINKIIQIIYPNIGNETHWSTPLDLIRDLHSNDLIVHTNFLPTYASVIRSLQSRFNFDSNYISHLKQYHISKLEHHSSSQHYLVAKNYIDNRYIAGDLKYKHKEKLIKQLDSHFNPNARSSSITYSDHFDPKRSRQDSQFNLEYLKSHHNEDYGISFLPTSHYLETHHQNISSESEFQLGSFAALYSKEKRKIFLNELNLLKIKSYKANDPLLGGFSFLINTSYQPTMMKSFHLKRGGFISAALGKTYRLHYDIDVFAFVGGESFKGSSDFFIRDYSNFGFILRGLFNTKTIVDGQIYSILSSNRIARFSLTQSFNISSTNFTIQAERYEQKDRTFNQYKASLGFLF